MKSTNKMLGTLLGGAMMLGILALPATALAVDKSKLVIQVSDSNPATWNLALSNAKNVQKELGKDNVELEIVAYGPGIGMLTADAEVANRIGEAVDSGIKVVACENTMRGLKLGKEDMHARVGYVQAGVVKIMQRQQQGYAYLRP